MIEQKMLYSVFNILMGKGLQNCMAKFQLINFQHENHMAKMEFILSLKRRTSLLSCYQFQNLDFYSKLPTLHNICIPSATSPSWNVFLVPMLYLPSASKPQLSVPQTHSGLPPYLHQPYTPFPAPHRGKGPAGATVSLVFDGGDGSLLAPVGGRGQHHVTVGFNEVGRLVYGAPVHAVAAPSIHQANELMVKLKGEKVELMGRFHLMKFVFLSTYTNSYTLVSSFATHDKIMNPDIYFQEENKASPSLDSWILLRIRLFQTRSQIRQLYF